MQKWPKIDFFGFFIEMLSSFKKCILLISIFFNPLINTDIDIDIFLNILIGIFQN